MAKELTELEKQKQQQKQKDAATRIKELEKLVEKQQKRIEMLQKKRFKIPKVTARRGSKTKNSYIRVAIPDTHGCLIEPSAWSAFLKDMKKLDPAHVIWLGDHLDCGGFLAQHHTMGYVHQTEYSFEEDVDAANDTLDQLAKAAPKALQEYIEGNHERRLEAFCTTQSLRNRVDAEYLRSMFSTEAQLHLEKRGIKWYRQGVRYDDCKVPATIRRGKCYFTHGSTSARFAADVMLKKFGNNVVFGHVHTSQEASTSTVDHGTLRAWCPGCLCQLQPLWRHTDPTRWNHGYGLQFVHESGEFLHFNVPVIEGRSLLEGFLEGAS